MQLSRRHFHLAALAAAAAALAPQAGALPVVASEDVALNRLTFGANAASRQELMSLGLEAWLEAQLALPAEDAELQRRLGAAKLAIEYAAGRDENNHRWTARKESIGYQYLDTPGDALLPLIDYEKAGMDYEERIRPAREVQAAALIRAVHAKAQLREVTAQFWHDHFNVNSQRDEHTAAYFAIHDRTLRANAFGNFRQLLGAAARSPAMLFYLNNESSRASPANENFARELFELHTFGAMHYVNGETTRWNEVPGAKDGLAQGYIDQDVYEAARALTGWSFGDGRYLDEGEEAPRTGAFHYVDRWHDPYQKRILGVEFEAFAGPMADGERLLDLVAFHPATARFLCLKLCRRLVSDDPPAALVARAERAWVKHSQADDQIAQVIRAIVLAPEFAATPPGKLKRPFEFLASYYRALGAEVASPSLGFLSLLSRAGWAQHECRPPTGHPDTSAHWANTATISAYVNIALNSLEDWIGAGRADLTKLLPAGTATYAEAYMRIALSLTGRMPDATAIIAFAGAIAGGDEAAPLDEKPEDRQWMLKSIAAAAALDPQFLYR